MAVDSYMYFQNYDNSYLQSETQTTLLESKEGLAAAFAAANNAHGLFELEDYSFDIEQVLNAKKARSRDREHTVGHDEDDQRPGVAQCD